MSKRVYELARDLAHKGPDLATKINSLGLSFSVNNHMSTLTEEQEDELRRALEREARQNMVEERIRDTVIRRKPRRTKEPEAPVRPALFGPPPVAPSVPSTPTPPARIVTAEHPGVQSVPLEPVRDAERFETPEPPVRLERTPTPVEPAPVVAHEPEPEAEPELVPTVAVRQPEPTPYEHTAVPETELEEPEVEDEAEQQEERIPMAAARSTTEEMTTRPATDAIVAAIARRQSQADAKSGKRSATVTGSIDPSLLQARLAADNKSFGPPPPRPAGGPGAKVPTGTRETFETDQAARRKRKGAAGKKVYGQSELYDQRSSRRRAQRKGGGGTTEITTSTRADHKKVIRMEEAILVSDLAHQMGVKAGEIALKLMMELGIKGANINTPLDKDAAALVAEGYGWTVEQVGFDMQRYLPQFEERDEDLEARPPVVTVMGHVDHGKTSLLDAVRTTNVAAGEAGGITQHIGAYRVDFDRGTVVFLDTPGHEAFTALRARGAQATDIVILVVAADDGVMPQTIEAINHAKAAGVPIVVAINKIDKQGANPDRIKQALSEYGLVPEEWGGETLYALVSAKNQTGIEELLQAVLLQAEVLELRGNSNRPAEAIIIESRLDVGRGPVATALVQEGTLEAGAIVVAGGHWGRIRALTDERGRKVKKAGPSIPVEITGLDGVPEAGATLYVVQDERAARTIAEHISDQQRQRELAKSAAAPADLERLSELFARGDIKELKLIIKADVQGSVKALQQALGKLGNAEVAVRVVHAAVGGITENDINLAASSGEGAAVMGFNVRPDTRATQHAEQMGVRVMTFTIIYEAVDAVKQLLTGMLAPTFEEVYMGRAEVRDMFNIPKQGVIAGCFVLDGTIKRGAKARVLRDARVVYESSINSLRRFKDDVREVKSGYECGIMVENFNDIKLGDHIETYELKEVRPTLA